MDTSAPVSVLYLRKEIHERRNRLRGRKDPVYGLLATLRYGVRALEPAHKNYRRPNEIQTVGRYAVFENYCIWGRYYPATLVLELVRQAQELDKPEPQRSQEARDFAHALHRGADHQMNHLNLAEISFARPKLKWILRMLREIEIEPQAAAEAHHG
jgi:hypothetical protein